MAALFPRDDTSPIWEDGDPFGDDEFVGIALVTDPAWPPKGTKGQGRHRYIPLTSYQMAPVPAFWDPPYNTLPKKADGSTVLLWGLWGSHKSGLTASMCLGIIKRAEDAVVAFCCGEGALDMGQTRMRSMVDMHGTTLKEIEDRFYVFPAVPLLTNEKDLDDFIATLKMAPKIPNIVVLDTMATMTPGISENDAGEFGGLFTDTGPIGKIKRAFPGVLIIILHHPGKNEERGARGTSALYGNFDGIFHLSFDDQTNLIDLYLEKLKVGKDKFSTHWHVRHSDEGVPVPWQIDQDQYKAMGVMSKSRRQTRMRRRPANTVRASNATSGRRVPGSSQRSRGGRKSLASLS